MRCVEASTNPKHSQCWKALRQLKHIVARVDVSQVVSILNGAGYHEVDVDDSKLFRLEHLNTEESEAIQKPKHHQPFAIPAVRASIHKSKNSTVLESAASDAFDKPTRQKSYHHVVAIALRRAVDVRIFHNRRCAVVSFIDVGPTGC